MRVKRVKLVTLYYPGPWLSCLLIDGNLSRLVLRAITNKQQPCYEGFNRTFIYPESLGKSRLSFFGRNFHLENIWFGKLAFYDSEPHHLFFPISVRCEPTPNRRTPTRREPNRRKPTPNRTDAHRRDARSARGKKIGKTFVCFLTGSGSVVSTGQPPPTHPRHTPFYNILRLQEPIL